MYADGLSFLEEERDAWRPFEALLELSDAQLEAQRDDLHGWTGRDLMAHMCAWIEWWLKIAQELALGPDSPTLERLHELGRDWEAQGEAVNAAIQAEWGALPTAEIRRRFETLPGDLRGYLTVVPEARWIKDESSLDSLLNNTLGHYAEHAADLAAILAGAER